MTTRRRQPDSIPHGRKRSRVDAPVQPHQAILIGLAADLPGVPAAISRIHVALRDKSSFSAHGIWLFNDPYLDGNRTRLQQRLQRLVQDSHSSSLERTLLLFVGHGESDGESYRLLCPDRAADPHRPITPDLARPEDWLDWRQLQEWLAPIQTRDLLVLMDSCESGCLISRETHRWLHQVSGSIHGNRVLLTGSSDNQQSWERGGICFFTESLAEGLEGWGGRNSRGAVDVEHLFRYLQQRVRARAYEAGVHQHPNRLMVPEQLIIPMELTRPDPRIELDDLLKIAIQEDRCLLWAGERLEARAHQGRFPERLAWPGTGRNTWLVEQDQALEPGEASDWLAQIQLSVLDTGFDTLLARTLRQRWPSLTEWSADTTEPPVETERYPVLLRPSGDPGAASFCFLTHLLQERFDRILQWLEHPGQPWDTLLVMGLAPEDPLTEQWLAVLAARFAPQIWLVFPYGHEHELVSHYEALNIQLVFAHDRDVLRAVRTARNTRRLSQMPLGRSRLLPLPPQQPWSDTSSSTPNNPYPGLVPFGEESYHHFFGRAGADGQSGDLQTLREDIHRHRKLILYGDSGNGKTSLLRAGLLYVLREVDGFRTFYTDAEDPLLQLAQTLSQEPAILDPVAPEDALERAAFLGYQSGCPVVICLDQIERAFLRDADDMRDTTRSSFAEMFAQAVERLEQAWPLGNWVLLLSIRKDQLALLQQFQKEWRYRLGQEVQLRELRPLTQDMAIQAITAPLPPSITIAPALLERLLKELHTQRNQPSSRASGDTLYHPPLLQLVCHELYSTARETGDTHITLEHYERTEGLEGLLQKLYHKTVAHLTAAQIRAVQGILVQLVNRHGLRKRRRWEEITVRLQTSQSSAADLEVAREVLTSHRIVRQIGQEGQRYLELGHDLLTTLAQQFVQQEDRLLDRILDEWETLQSQDPPQGHFSRSLTHTMRDTVGWSERLPASLSAPVLECYQHSIRHHRVWTGIWSGVLVLVLAILSGALWTGWKARQDRLRHTAQLAAAERKAQQLKVQQGLLARRRLAEVLAENAHTALIRRQFFKAHTRLYASLTLRDSSLARFLWWRLRYEPLFWKLPTKGMCYHIAFSPNGKQIAAGCMDRNLYLVDPLTRKTTHIQGHKDQILSVAYAPNGRYLAAGGRDGRILLLHRKTGKRRWLQGSKMPVWSLTFSPDSRILLAGEHGGALRFWSLTRSDISQTAVRPCFPTAPWGTQFSPDGKTLASVHGKNGLCIWRVSDRKLLRVLGPHQGSLFGVVFSTDGKLIHTADDQHLWTWDWQKAKASKVPHGHGRRVFSLTLHPRYPYLATASWDRTVRVWDPHTRQLLRTLEDFQDRVFHVAFHPTRPWLASLETVGRMIRLWDLSVKQRRRQATGHTEPSLEMAFHPTQPWLVTGSADKTVRLWDLATGRVLRVLRGHRAGVWDVVFHPDGQTLASASSDKTVRLWDLHTGQVKKILVDRRTRFRSASFHPTQPWLAAAGTWPLIILWNWKTGAKLKELQEHQHGILSLAFHPTRPWLVSAGWNPNIRLWDVHTGKTHRILRGHASAVWTLQWSQDGRFLYSAGEDRTVRRWDPHTGHNTILGRLPARIYHIALHPKRQQILAACADGAIYMWDTRHRRFIGQKAFVQETSGVAYHPSGRWYAATGIDGSVQLFHTHSRRITWRAPLLQHRPPRLLTHRGWINLSPTQASPPIATSRPHATTRPGPTSQTVLPHPKPDPSRLPKLWRTVLQRAVQAQLSPTQRHLCLYTYQGTLEAWTLQPFQRLWRRKFPSPQSLQSTSQGCLVLTQQRLVHISWRGTEKLIARGVQAASVVQEKLLYATRQRVFVQPFLPLLKRKPATVSRREGLGARVSQDSDSYPFTGEVTALTLVGSVLVLGQKTGRIELLTLRGGQVLRRSSLDGTPSIAVSRLTAGPPNTVFAGYINGFVGHWSLSTSDLLYSARLNGPIVHLMYANKHMYTATRLGAYLIQDMSIYSMSYCQIWRQIRAKAPLQDPKSPSHRQFLGQHPCQKRAKTSRK